MLLCPETSTAQTDEEYDEIVVSANIAGIGNYDVPAIIKNDTAYLAIASLFDILNIKNNTSKTLDSVSGFFINLDSTYLFDYARNVIVKNKLINTLKPGSLFKSETGMYASAEVFNTYFGLNCQYNMRTLSVKITSKAELPAIREARLAFLRKNIAKLKNDQTADTVLKNAYSLFHFGTFDWSVVSNQLVDGPTDTRINLGLGGILAGGETILLANFSPSQKINWKQQFYQWRLINNDARTVKQVQLGKIIVPTTASIFAPIVGAHISNISTLVKRSFSTYTVSNYTEPGWTVELYVNNVLIDYKKADANGFYTFEVPLVYGSSAVKLRFFGPFGEERSREEAINIPFNLLAPNLFEYSISSGLVEDDSNTIFTKVNMNYGITKRLTVGSGVEYLTSVKSGNFMPYVNTSFRIGKSLLASGEYSYGVRSRGVLNYRTPSNAQFEVSYTHFEKGQLAVNTQVTQERRAVIGLPLRLRKLSMFSQITVNQSWLATTRFLNTEWLMSGFVYGMDVNVSTYGIFYDNLKPNVYSNFSVAFRVPFALQLRSQLQYRYNTGEVISIKESLEKNTGNNLFAGVFYEQNLTSKITNIGLQFRYNFRFAQVGVSSMKNNKRISVLESARGSVVFDKKTNYAGTSNIISIGRSGISIAPFLDINCNGIKDPDEPKVSGLKFSLNGGNIMPEGKDTIIRIMNLEPNNKYFLELNKFSFDNISWQIKKLTYSIETEGNKLKYVPIPVAVVGEVNGNVYMNKNGVSRGQGQIYVCIYKDNALVTKILSEPDGYFSYIGLPPGTYTAMLDSVQMEKINKQASSPRNFTIKAGKEGDLVDGLEFTVSAIDTNIIGMKVDNAIADDTVARQQTAVVVKDDTVAKQQTIVAVKDEAAPVKLTTTTIAKDKITGQVFAKNRKRFYPQGSIYVHLYKGDLPVKRVLTKADGYFSFTDVEAGDYTVKVDEAQLQKINILASQPVSIGINDTTSSEDIRFLLIYNEMPFDIHYMDGNVVLHSEDTIQGMKGIGISIYKRNKLIKKLRTRSDGSFSIPYLAKGEYTIDIDRTQLQSMGYEATALVRFRIDGTTKTNFSLLFSVYRHNDKVNK
ncbi:hypothetical protein CAP35_08815 [Chitinophagaceae bacterium IBVUCB1]|nr:hypothetical protein CAP35_08815 [Chitinophagaceae bacterium IBVUCB1]